MGSKQKYFIDIDQEACLSAAEAYFGVKREQLTHEYSTQIPGVLASDVQLLAGLIRDTGVDRDGSFTLYYEPEGVFLELYPPAGKGARARREDLTSYVGRKALSNLDTQAVGALLEKGAGRQRIAPSQPESILNEDVSIIVSALESEAYLKLLPPDPGGALLDLAQTLLKIQQAGVIHGLDQAAVQAALNTRNYGNTYTIARATPPVHGENGYLIFHFEQEKTGKPKEDGQGRVDYKALDLFEPVTEGQLLLTRRLATPGTPGASVLGKELKPTPGKDVLLPKAKNVTVNEEKTAMHAAVSGMVDFTAGSLNVSNVYIVRGNADLNVGNLNFDGSVIVSGNVISGITIQASGNIEVGGVVEAAELTAGGNILLKRGIQGMDKGRIVATGSVTSGYIERATVQAGGNIHANTIAHSTVEAGDSLFLEGKIGSLVGGYSRVSNEIAANVLGSVADTQTEIEVGVLPQKRARMVFLLEESKKCREELQKLQTIATYLAKTPEDDAEKMELKKSVSESLNRNERLISEYTTEIDRLNQEFEQAAHGKVHVRGTAYANVRISIAAANYKITQPTEHATFKMLDGDIRFVPYEADS